MKIHWDLHEDQWMHVICCTAMACAMSESLLGLLIFPFWFGVALLGRNIP